MSVKAILLWAGLGACAGAFLLWAGGGLRTHLTEITVAAALVAVAFLVTHRRSGHQKKETEEKSHEFDGLRRDLDASSRYLVKELERTTSVLRKKIFDLHNLFTITGEMSVITDLNDLLNGFLLTIAGRVGCYNVVLFLRGNEDGDGFSAQFWKGLARKEVEKLTSIPADDELVRVLAREPRPLIIEIALKSRRLRSISPSFRQFEVVAPLVNRGEVTGIAFLGHKADGQSFSEMDFELVSILSHQVSAAMENAKLLEKTRLFYKSSIRALVAAVEARDAYTKGHAERTSIYAAAIASTMGFPEDEIENLSFGVLIHDIGKIAMSESLLKNSASPLGERLWEEVKTHPKIGATILGQVDTLKWAIPLVLQHHERFDGSGYPHGLAGEEINLHARILAIADSFDAMTSDRSYRKAMSTQDALEELQRNAGTQFDPEIVKIAVPVLKREIQRIERIQLASSMAHRV